MAEILVALGASLFALLVSSTIAYQTLCSLPEDFLCTERPLYTGTQRYWRRPLGGLLVLAGIIMALPGVPGQGILTTCIGLILLDIPYFRGRLRSFLSKPTMLRITNRLRHRAGRPPFLAPPYPSNHSTTENLLPTTTT